MERPFCLRVAPAVADGRGAAVGCRGGCWGGVAVPAWFLGVPLEGNGVFWVFLSPQRMSPPSPLTALAERVVAVDVACKQCCTFRH